MFDPMTIAMILQGVGTVMSAGAAEAAGKAAKEADFLSASSADRAAADAVKRGQLKELQAQLRASEVVSAAEVHQSSSGTDVNVGGNFAARRATLAVSAVDQRVIERNAAMEAYGLRERARGYRQHGLFAESAGKNAAVGTFLGGIGNAASQGVKVGAQSIEGDTGPSVREAPPAPSFFGDN